MNHETFNQHLMTFANLKLDWDALNNILLEHNNDRGITVMTQDQITVTPSIREEFHPFKVARSLSEDQVLIEIPLITSSISRLGSEGGKYTVIHDLIETYDFDAHLGIDSCRRLTEFLKERMVDHPKFNVEMIYHWQDCLIRENELYNHRFILTLFYALAVTLVTDHEVLEQVKGEWHDYHQYGGLTNEEHCILSAHVVRTVLNSETSCLGGFFALRVICERDCFVHHMAQLINAPILDYQSIPVTE